MNGNSGLGDHLKMPTTNVTSLAKARSDRLTCRIREVTQGLTANDLDILQNDRTSRPVAPHLPAVMAGSFRDWLTDSYGPIGRETAMAPENMGCTHEKFLEEACEGDDEEMAAMATVLLARGRSGPTQLVLTQADMEQERDSIKAPSP